MKPTCHALSRLCWLLLFCFPVTARGQWGDQVVLVSESLIWGPFHDVEMDSGRAFCALGYGLAVFDILPPTQIQLTAATGLPGTTEGVCVEGDYAYLAGGTFGLQILDITDLTSPLPYQGGWDTPGYAYELVKGGDFLYMADGSGGLRVIDISETAAPQEVAALSLGGWARDLYLEGEILYVAAESMGLKVVNVAQPETPQVIGQYNTGGVAQGVCKTGNLLYLADGSGGVLIFDVADSTQPDLLGQWATSGTVHEVQVAGSYAYAADDQAGVSILNVSNPELPYLAGRYNSAGLAWSIALSDTTLFLADDWQGLVSVSISDPQAPAQLAAFSLPGEVSSIWVDGNFAYAARGFTDKVTILSVQNPALPLPVAEFSPPGPSGEVVDVRVQSSTCFTAHLTDGICLTDVTDPYVPVFLQRQNTVGEAVDLVPRVPLIYIADSWEGLVMISLTPDSAWHLTTADWAKGVILNGDTAYVCQWSAGVALIDISDPTQPQLLTEIDTPGLARRCAVAGNYIYVADDEAGLTVLNELTGAVVGGYDTPGQTWDVKLAGNFACLADGFGGVLVLDISDPTNPRYAGSYPTPGMAKEIYWDGENIYVADQYCLGIYRFTGTGVITAPGAGLPEQFALEAHPNPFNSELRLSLWLPGSVQALLEVFNLAGQRVARLNEAVLLPGQHEFFWRADDLASGIYLVRVQMGDFSLSRKVVLLK